MLCFRFHSVQILYNCLLISSPICGLFRSVLVCKYLKILRTSFCYWFLVEFHLGQRTHSVIWTLLNLLRLLFRPEYSVSWWMFCVLGRDLCWVGSSVNTGWFRLVTGAVTLVLDLGGFSVCCSVRFWQERVDVCLGAGMSAFASCAVALLFGALVFMRFLYFITCRFIHVILFIFTLKLTLMLI